MDSTNSSLSSSSLKFTEKICAVVIPIVAIIEALIFAASGCFNCHKLINSKKSRYGYQEIVRLSEESRFTVNEVEALYELFKKLSSSIIDDGLIHKVWLLFYLITSSEAFILEKQLLFFKIYSAIYGPNFELQVKEMVVAILKESDMELSDELLEQIVDNTFADADADKDGRINKEEWKAFVFRRPSLLRNMTLPYLKDITTAFPSFVFNTEVDD
ncbi:Calcineurin B-like protein 10 [Striga hermonthica]|uniref:Calcineurin B-like protein n=1 Tax=Striga hermonthica TaxID=68872 RepID=A0A9N7MMV1_STRHE|nr:Calcineurin B-like protein 10 [Striga hermonthica]